MNIIKEDLFGKDSDMKDMDDEVALDQLSNQCVRKLLTYLRQALKMQNEEKRDLESMKSKSDMVIEQPSMLPQSMSQSPKSSEMVLDNQWSEQSILPSNSFL